MLFRNSFNVNGQTAWLVASGSISAVVIIYLIYRNRSRKRNNWRAPFSENSQRTREPLEFDRDRRAQRIKRQFKEGEVPMPLDAIVIGSGLGGLSVAAILAKTGRKVLILEQHSKAGGCCHTFVKDDTEWNVAFQYIGEMDPEKDLIGFLMDQLTEGQLEWARLDDNCDNLVYKNVSSEKTERIPITANNEDHLTNDLIKRFPNDEAGIREFFRMVREAAKETDYFGILKIFPEYLARFLVRIRFLIPGLNRFLHYYCDLSLESVLKRLFPKNEQLQSILGYCWSCVGSAPNELSFGVQSLIFQHFSNGAYFPVGGASQIPYTLIGTIEKWGGRVLMKARVKEILLSSDKRSAIGVRVECGDKKHFDIKAPLIISDAGVVNTFDRLLPVEVAEKTQLDKLLLEGRLKPGPAVFQVFVGLNGSQTDLQLPSGNFLVSYLNDFNEIDHWNQLSLDEAVQTRIPFLRFDFPSAKDPSYELRYPGRSTCSIQIFVPFGWFEPWSKEEKGKRAESYVAFKMALAEQAWEQVIEVMPQLVDRRRFMDAGSPLTAQHYLATIQGEAYGLHHDRYRFSSEMITVMRPRVKEIANLYLTGHDILAGGFAGALMGGIVCANAILLEKGETFNLMDDLRKLMKKTTN